MELNKLWALVLFILNKEESGAVITPDRRNTLLSVAQQRYYSLMYKEFERTQKVNDSLSVFDKMTTLVINASTGIAPLPSDYYHCTGIIAPGRSLDIVTDQEYAKRLKNSLTGPTLNDSIALFISGAVQFKPNSLGSAVMTYLGYPKEPFYDWDVDENGNEVYIANWLSWSISSQLNYIRIYRNLNYSTVYCTFNNIISGFYGNNTGDDHYLIPIGANNL
jgi:hypothetical protein